MRRENSETVITVMEVSVEGRGGRPKMKWWNMIDTRTAGVCA